jgi:CheY-like chemotaxis protein
LGDGEIKERASHPPISLSPHLPPSPSPQSTTILIAEDNDATITTLSGYLSAKGYHVLRARDGWEAFAHTREHQPDLIIMDIQMPDMDGLEAIRHIRSDPHSPSIPIIALTALAMPGDREKCLAAGADEYLSKPVSLRKLRELLEKLFAKQGDEQQEL